MVKPSAVPIAPKYATPQCTPMPTGIACRTMARESVCATFTVRRT
jgi:hypothetical protein